jgi:hypothetical protein
LYKIKFEKIMALGDQVGPQLGKLGFFFDFCIRNIFKNLLLRNHRAREVVVYMEASRRTVDELLLKSWSPGVGWEHNRGNCFYMFD